MLSGIDLTSPKRILFFSFARVLLAFYSEKSRLLKIVI